MWDQYSQMQEALKGQTKGPLVCWPETPASEELQPLLAMVLMAIIQGG